MLPHLGCRGIHGTKLVLYVYGARKASEAPGQVRLRHAHHAGGWYAWPVYGGSGTYVSARCLTQVEEQRAVGLLLLLIEGHWVEPSARWADASGLVRVRLGASLVLH